MKIFLGMPFICWNDINDNADYSGCRWKSLI